MEHLADLLESTSLDHRLASNAPLVFPQELLDRIVKVTDCVSIISLCHAIPSLKHISQAIYDIGTSSGMKMDMLWPDFYLPCQFYNIPEIGKGKLPARPIILCQPDLIKAKELCRIVSRYGGVVKVQAHSIEYWNNVSCILPKTIDIYVGPDPYGFEFYSDYVGRNSYESISHLFTPPNTPSVLSIYPDTEMAMKKPMNTNI
ncbi:UNVERIFIED_CONTAM: hypothetical protein HDU68_011381 [Siphonaria sp. JEL0065]|nr:hypothetical protein HDU68_011381 [Siphonaria sp. JEL0065]